MDVERVGRGRQDQWLSCGGAADLGCDCAGHEGFQGVGVCAGRGLASPRCCADAEAVQGRGIAAEQRLRNGVVRRRRRPCGRGRCGRSVGPVLQERGGEGVGGKLGRGEDARKRGMVGDGAAETELVEGALGAGTRLGKRARTDDDLQTPHQGSGDQGKGVGERGGFAEDSGDAPCTAAGRTQRAARSQCTGPIRPARPVRRTAHSRGWRPRPALP